METELKQDPDATQPIDMGPLLHPREAMAARLKRYGEALLAMARVVILGDTE